MTARRFAFFALAVIFILALVLVFADVVIARSQTNNESMVASSHGAGTPQMQPPTIQVYVEPGGRMQEALRAAFAERAASNPQIGQLQLVDSPDSGQPLMYVDVKEQNVRWFGVTGRAAVTVQVDYSTNGDLYFRETDPPSFVSSEYGAAFQLSGDYTLSDVSNGLLSLPGYHRFLAEKMADHILSSMQQEFLR